MIPRGPSGVRISFDQAQDRLCRQSPLGGPAEVLEYLSRYTHRTAISNERIVAIRDGDVLLRVRADDQGGKRVVTFQLPQRASALPAHPLAGARRHEA